MTDIDLSTLQPVHNADAHQFEIQIGDDLAVIVYRMNDKTISMLHTEVPPAFEGKGIAGKLAKFALDWSKENGYKVNPLCPYVKTYIQRHAEYQDNAVGF